MSGQDSNKDFGRRVHRRIESWCRAIWWEICHVFHKLRLVALIILFVWGAAWMWSNLQSAQSAEFDGIVVRIDLPSESAASGEPGPMLPSVAEPAIVTVRLAHGSTMEWKAEPMLAAYLRPGDRIVKEARQRPAVFRDGRQLTSGGPFRRDEVALPSPQPRP